VLAVPFLSEPRRLPEWKDRVHRRSPSLPELPELVSTMTCLMRNDAGGDDAAAAAAGLTKTTTRTKVAEDSVAGQVGCGGGGASGGAAGGVGPNLTTNGGERVVVDVAAAAGGVGAGQQPVLQASPLGEVAGVAAAEAAVDSSSCNPGWKDCRLLIFSMRAG
jgi:hypothetical protein